MSQQLHRALATAIDDDRLQAGAWLPSTRQLADELELSRGVVVRVYERLTDEGLVITRRGSGTRVLARRPPPASKPAAPPEKPAYDLRPGIPDLTLFPRSAWGAATEATLRGMSSSDLGYVAPWGDVLLREVLAAHVTRTRGTVVTAREIIITAGVVQALTLTCRVLRAAGHTTLALENPCNMIQREILRGQGLRLVDVPVDAQGIDVAALHACGARAVLTTPTHQFPSGVTLSADRRGQLAAWARSVDGLVIEDDYDVDLATATRRTPSLRALAVDHVLHTNSVSKSLAPALRVGWAVPPPRMLADLMAAKRDDDFGGGALTQRTVAHLLTSGGYHRHLRRTRSRYRERHSALVEALTEHLPDWRITGAGVGLHLCLLAPPGVDDSAVVTRAASRGVLVLGLSTMRRGPGPAGLVLGHTRLAPDAATDAVARLAAAVADPVGPASRPSNRTTFPLPSPALAGRLGTTSIDYFPGGIGTG